MDRIWPGTYPRGWSELSFDFKILIGLFGTILLLLLLSNSLSIRSEATVQAVFIVASITIAIVYRRRRKWRWVGAERKQFLAAAISLGFTVFFFGLLALAAPPNSPHIFPWFLAGLEMGMFNVLAGLRLARIAQIDFASDCISNVQASS